MIGQRYAPGKSPYLFLEATTKNGYDHHMRPWWQVLHEREPGMVSVFSFLVIAGIFRLDRYRYDARQYAFFREVSKKFFSVETEWRKVRTFFNHDEVRKMIQQKIDNELKRREIDVKKVFDLLSDAETMALTHVDKCGNIGNPAAVLAVADRYATLIGMTAKKGGSGPGLPGGDNNGQLPGASDTFNSILKDGMTEATVVKEVPDDAS